MINPGHLILYSWLAFILFWFVMSFGVKKDTSRSFWHKTFWPRIIIVFTLLTFLWQSSSFGKATRRFGFFQPVNPSVLTWLGAIMTLVGVAFAIWARIHLCRNWSPAPAMKENHELITSGPYQFVRHPIYTGMIVAALGSALAINNFFWLMLIIAVLIFVSRINKEEKFMLRLFPDQYPGYKKRTKALVPFVW